MNKLNLSDDKVNSLLGLAGKKLGKDPEALREQLKSGDIGGVLSGMDEGSAARVQSVLSNPDAIQTLLRNEQLQQLLAGLGKK